MGFFSLSVSFAVVHNKNFLSTFRVPSCRRDGTYTQPWEVYASTFNYGTHIATNLWLGANRWSFYHKISKRFFDLLAGASAIEIVDRFKNNNKIVIPVILLALNVLSIRFAFSYNIVGVFLPLLFYLFRNDCKRMFIFLIVVIPLMVFAMYYIGYGTPWGSLDFFMCSEFCMVFVLPFILLYNGEKGKQFPKWCYYGFYPVHLLLLGIIKLLFWF